MGLTIHYDLKFKGTKEEAYNKLEQLRNIALDLPFTQIGNIWELDYSKNFNDEAENTLKAPKDSGYYRWAKIQYNPSHIYSQEKDYAKYKGYVFMAWAGEGCEPTNLGLISKDGKNWSGSAFTKTQYAEHFVKAHLLVISILDVCKKLEILKEVSDEGDYWKTRDLSVLGKNINESTQFIAGIGDILKKSFGKDNIKSAIDESKNIVKVKKEVKHVRSQDRR